MPANLQVGEDGAAVYTTKIMLALHRVSELQSHPFMVRVRINIAGSKALGWVGGWVGCMSTPVVQHIYGCSQVSACERTGLTQALIAWLLALTVQTWLSDTLLKATVD